MDRIHQHLVRFYIELAVMLMSPFTMVETIAQLVPALKLTPRATIGLSDETAILGTYGMAFLPDGNTVYTDKLENTVKRVDKRWHLVGRIGSRGNNDGQFQGPGPICASANRIAVSDYASNRIQVFSASFEHLSTFYTDAPVFDIVFDASGQLWIAKLPNHMGETLVNTDIQGTILKKITPHNSSSDPFNSIFNMSICPDGRIALAFMTMNLIELWDTSGIFLCEFSHPGLPAAATQLEISRGLFLPDLKVPEDNIFWDITSDRLGMLYVLADRYTEHPGRDVFVFDGKGTLLRTIVLPRESTGIFLNAGNDLFSIEQRRTLIGVYHIND